jgi:hypothetical protein
MHEFEPLPDHRQERHCEGQRRSSKRLRGGGKRLFFEVPCRQINIVRRSLTSVRGGFFSFD